MAPEDNVRKSGANGAKSDDGRGCGAVGCVLVVRTDGYGCRRRELKISVGGRSAQGWISRFGESSGGVGGPPGPQVRRAYTSLGGESWTITQLRAQATGSEV